MIIDCDTCVMDGTSACADCIVPVLLAGTGGRIEVGTGGLPGPQIFEGVNGFHSKRFLYSSR